MLIPLKVSNFKPLFLSKTKPLLTDVHGAVAIRTFNGDIALSLLETMSVNLQVTVEGEGRITNMLEGAELESDGLSLHDSLNGGGALLSVKTTNGHIALASKSA